MINLFVLYRRVLRFVLSGCCSLGCLLLLKTVLLALTKVQRLVVTVQPSVRHRGVVRPGVLAEGGHHEVGSEVGHAGGRPLLLLQHCLLHLGELWGGDRGEQGHIRSCIMWPSNVGLATTVWKSYARWYYGVGLPWWRDASWWGRSRLWMTFDLRRAWPSFWRLEADNLIWNTVRLQKLSTKVLGPSCRVINISQHTRFPKARGKLKATSRCTM